MSAAAGLPRAIDATYGVSVTAPHDDPQRYIAASSNPDASASATSSDRNTEAAEVQQHRQRRQ